MKDDEKCPHCVSNNLEVGYGFAYGGGLGTYTIRGDCGKFIKKEMDDGLEDEA